MAKQPHQLDRLAKQAGVELDGQAERLHGRVQAELFDDLHALGDDRFVQHVREQAATDPQYLTRLYTQIGAEAFNAVWDKAIEAPLHAPASAGADMGEAPPGG